MRYRFLIDAYFTPPGELVNVKQMDTFEASINEDKWSIVNDLCREHYDEDRDVYRLWDTFVLIFDYFIFSRGLKQEIKDLKDMGRIKKVNNQLLD